MNAERLLAHYERIADSPDAIARLRRFILDLAVRGKLVPQDPNDEPALELLDRIAAEKEPSSGRASAQSLQQLSFENPKDSLFQLPASWLWIPATYPARQISDVGKKIQTKDVLPKGSFPVVDQGKQFIRGYCNDASKVVRVVSSIILFGDHTRETKLIDFDFVVGADGVKLLQPLSLSPRYYFLALQWLPLGNRGYGRHFKLLKAAHIPLAPLTEQHRIVAKVDELMALCDQLEKSRMAQEETRDRLTAASLARLNDPAPETFQTDAGFALDALPSMTARPDQIKQLRQTILNLAVRGKLVPQDPNDEPASEALRRIAAELPHLSEQDEIREPVPFIVSDGWRWTRLGNVVGHSDAGWSPKTENHPRVGNNWGVLKVSAVSWGEFRDWENKEVLAGTTPRLQAKVNKSDFLISRANTAELVARAVIVEEEPVNLMMSDKIVRLNLSANVDHRYVLIVNNDADFARRYYAEQASGVSPSMKNVSRDVILNLPVPLPPLAEQERIVAKVDELMAVCDRLEASLAAGETRRSRLLDAVLHEALESSVDRLEAAA